MLSENSFVTVEYADAYFAMQLSGEEWETYEVETKEKALNTALTQINTYCVYEFEVNEAPENVKIAQCELAYNLAKVQAGTIEAEAEQALKKMKAGPVTFEFYGEEDGASEETIITDYIKKLLSSDCECTFKSDYYVGTVEF